ALGVALLGASVVAYNVRQGFGLIDADRAFMVIGLAALGAASTLYATVFALRSLALRLRPVACLYPEGWLTCTTGVGTHLDLIPLVLVEAVVPRGERLLEVRLRHGASVCYPFRFELGMGRFFDGA